jgi:hypothetical protein
MPPSEGRQHCRACGDEHGIAYDCQRPGAPGRKQSTSDAIQARTLYERHEDMSPDGKLMLLVEDDGDIIVSVIGRGLTDELRRAQVQFCTVGSGGGRSQHTRTALRSLILAIQKDNEERPIL